MAVPSRILAGLVAVALAVRGLEAQAPPSDQADSGKQIRAIVVQLQAAVRNDQRRTVATLILFPLAIKKAQFGVTSVPSVAVFMKVYPSVFNRQIRDALLKQNPDSVVVHNGTATIAEGRIVIGYRCATTDPRSCETGVTQVTLYKR